MKDKDLQPVQDEPKKDERKSIQGAKKQNARVFLWVVCALYLLYLVSKLVKDLVGGMVDTPSTRIMVIVASVVFTVVAIYLLIISIRHAVSSFKDSVAAMAAADEEDADSADAPSDNDEDFEPLSDEDADEPTA